jgi:hypothetical protein
MSDEQICHGHTMGMVITDRGEPATGGVAVFTRDGLVAIGIAGVVGGPVTSAWIARAKAEALIDALRAAVGAIPPPEAAETPR